LQSYWGFSTWGHFSIIQNAMIFEISFLEKGTLKHDKYYLSASLSKFSSKLSLQCKRFLDYSFHLKEKISFLIWVMNPKKTT
jgi:hypothetical protein